MRRLAAFACAAACAAAAAALEIEFDSFVGNSAFDVASTKAVGAAGAFEPILHGGGSMAVSERIGDAFEVSAGFEIDPVLRNTAFTRVAFQVPFAKVRVGPFFGPFGTDLGAFSAGISSSFTVELPGIAFGTFRTDTTIGAGLSSVDLPPLREMREIEAGVWVPNVILSGRYAAWTFSEAKSADLTVVDEKVRWELAADVHKKNVPYTARLAFAYENLKRKYVSSTVAVDELGAALVGLDLELKATDFLRVFAGGEAALYAWGIGELGSPAADRPLFKARLGFGWELGPVVGRNAR